MAYLLGCENIQLEYPTARIFDSLTLGVNSGDRIGIVGRNGDGKSTLLNTLTDAGVLEEDKLFATLDPTTRLLELPGGQNILLTDTVGFIRKLPHHLIECPSG